MTKKIRGRPRLRKPKGYYWAEGSRMRGDPLQFGAYMESLRQQNEDEVLTPEQALEDAYNNPDSPFNTHRELHMNDRRAAHEFRLLHVRKVFRSLVVVYPNGEEEPMIVRAFVKIAHDYSHKYTHIHAAMSNEGYQEQVLSQALQELEAFRTKYQHLDALASLFEVLNDVLRAHAHLRPGRFQGDFWDAQRQAQGGVP